MASILNLAIPKLRLALVTASILAFGFAAYGQRVTRPGCVILLDANGSPYELCEELAPLSSPQQWCCKRCTSRDGIVIGCGTVECGPQCAGSGIGPGGPPRLRPSPPGPGFGPSPPGPGGPRIAPSPLGPGYGGPIAPPSPLRLWAVRALIEPAEMPPPDGMGYGIVAFTTRPLSHNIERYKSICEAYKATLISVLELPPNTPPSEQMVTYWPITNKNTPEAQRADCPYLVSNYALRLGLDAIQDADKQNQGLASRRGPFLIAWAPSESRFVPDAVVLVLDLSDKDSQRSFIEVFQDWRQKITDNPEVWRRQSGFNTEMVRRIIRDTFDRYGDGVLRLISRP